MFDVMLDLETMGTGSNAAITAIGAVEFSIKDRAIGRKFYSIVDLESSVAAGGVMDAGTVLWWMKQNDAARAMYAQPALPIGRILHDFANWLRPLQGCAGVWGNGSDFDNGILLSAYRRLGLEAPWKFYNNRCFRTVKAMHPRIEIPAVGTHHNAVNDAEYQAKYLIALLGEEDDY